ncbi:hypothetical protein CK203_115775 [Vitis vinifera]|uniref:Retrotransposon gag domain-containing protein n=1 Tax=Vitis vinifera TaxID=29760 RepID=A0A438EZG8_VITVI|nr:hypothetical protein CK203_115775 [Vitis vinifera]
MQDNESLREFVKRFGQAVLQVEACSMDAILQIFKRNICPGTPFSNRPKNPTTMDDLFRRANKYSMLEDDVRAATQQVLVARRPSRGDAERNTNLRTTRPSDRRQEGPSGQDPKEQTHPQGIITRYVPSTKIMVLGKETFPKIATLEPRAPTAPKAVISYINGGPSDEEYDSRRKKTEVVACRINTRTHQFHPPGLTGGGPRPIDGTIISHS